MPRKKHKTKDLSINYLGRVRPEGIDWDLIKSFYNITSMYEPITQIRLLVWSGYILITIYLLLLQIYLNSSKHIIKWLNNNVIPLTAAVYMLEPFMLLLHMTKARYPHFLRLAEDVDPSEQNTFDTVVLIPCHNAIQYSEDIDSFAEVLRRATRHFSPETIFIVDNGSKRRNGILTKKVAYDIDPQINYLSYRYSNRSVALWQGLKYIQRVCGPHIKNVMIVDANVQIPVDYKINRLLLADEKVGGLIYPLLANSKGARDNLLTKMQRLEYQLTTLRLAAQDELNITPAEQSGCGLYRLDIAEKILLEHSGEFNDEERLFSANLHNTYSSLQKYKFHLDKGPQFMVYTPQSYCGFGDNLWRQRVRSWNAIFFEQFWPQICKPLLAEWNSSRIIILKFYQAQLLSSELINVFRYAYLLVQFKNPSFWKVFALSAIVEAALLIVFNYKKLPMHQRNDFKHLTLYPAYLIANNFLAHMAFWRVFLYTFTIKESTRLIAQKVKNSEFPSFPSKQPRKYHSNSIYAQRNEHPKVKSTKDSHGASGNTCS